MGKDVIVACDFASAEQTFAFLDKFTLHTCINKSAHTLLQRKSLTTDHIRDLNRRIGLHRHVGQGTLHTTYHLAVDLKRMVGMHTTHDMHLGDLLRGHLSGTLLNLVKGHHPGISIARTTTKRAKLAVEDAYIRGLDMYISVIIYKLATYLSFTLCCQLAKQP